MRVEATGAMFTFKDVEISIADNTVRGGNGVPACVLGAIDSKGQISIVLHDSPCY